MVMFEIGVIRQLHLSVDEFQVPYQEHVLTGRVGREPGGCQEPETDMEVTAEAPGPPLAPLTPPCPRTNLARF